MHSPAISFNFPTGFAPWSLNYANVIPWGRLYFISNWVNENGLWTAQMEVDTLATFKTQIGNSTQYVLRAASAFDGNIADSQYPTTCRNSMRRTLPDFPWASSFGAGRYVIGIINGDSSGVGSVSYYVFNMSGFNELKNYLFSTTSWIDPGDSIEISEDLLKALFNPFQYIVSCKWFPFVPGTSGSSVTTLSFGHWEVPISSGSCWRLQSDALFFQSMSFSVPKHPLQSTRGDYLNLNPYSRYTLIFNPICVMQIDNTFLVETNTLNAYLSTDLITGEATLALSNGGTSNIFTQMNGVIGVDIQLAQTTTDHLGTFQGVINASESFSQIWNPLKWGSILSGTVGGISSAVEASIPQLQTAGGTGKISDYYFSPSLVGQFFELVEENQQGYGRPLCKRRVINTLSGFILCSDADVSIPGTKEENISIKRYMDSGFYYE